MQDPTYPLVPVLSLICFFLVLIPLPWHLQAWNVGTCSYMIWAAIALLNQFINSVVWRDNAINYAPVWCDISSRLIVAISIAIPAASLTISRRLYKISRVQTVMASARERKREMAIDLGLCVGLPIFSMVLYFFVQGHRFDIFEQIGCMPAVYNTPLAYALIWSWPLILGSVSMVYCALTVTSFLKRRREMSQFLSSNSAITFSRYFRLMALALLDTFLTVPLGAFAIWLNCVQSQVNPWPGLTLAHFDFSAVDQIPAVLWRLSKWNILSLWMDRAFIILCACVFFSFFGFAEESRKNYTRVYWTVAKRFGYSPPMKGLSYTGSSAFRTPNIPNMSAQTHLSTNRDFTGSAPGPRGGLKILVSHDAKIEKRDSFLSSIGDLSSSFSIEVDEKDDEKFRDGHLGRETGNMDGDNSNSETSSPSSESPSSSSSVINFRDERHGDESALDGMPCLPRLSVSQETSRRNNNNNGNTRQNSFDMV